MLTDLKYIWKQSFDDDDAYIEFYFSKRYRPENTLVYHENNRAVSMLTLLPVTVVGVQNEWPAHYVYAVATLPEFRNKGISAALAVQADEQMRAAGDALAVVVPATKSLFLFYERQGFSTAFFRRIVSFSVTAIGTVDSGVLVQPLDNVDKFYALRERYFGHSGFFVRWDRDALQYAAEECRVSGGEVFYFSDGANEGYTVVEPIDQTVVVKEMAVPEILAPAVLSFLKKQYANYQRLVFRLPVGSPLWKNEGTIEPVAMIKWFIEPPQGIALGNAYISLLKD